MSLVIKSFNTVGSIETYEHEFPQLLTEGASEMEVLCPVSKLTGFPMSMQSALLMITEGNERIADALFQEIPSVQSSDAVSDDDKLRLLVSRLDSGSFFENDKVAEILGNVAKEFFPDADVEKVTEEAKISFNKEDAPPSET